MARFFARREEKHILCPLEKRCLTRRALSPKWSPCWRLFRARSSLLQRCCAPKHWGIPAGFLRDRYAAKPPKCATRRYIPTRTPPCCGRETPPDNPPPDLDPRGSTAWRGYENRSLRITVDNPAVSERQAIRDLRQ